MYHTTENGDEVAQGRLRHIHCKKVSCDRYRVIFLVLLSTMFGIRVAEGAFILTLFLCFLQVLSRITLIITEKLYPYLEAGILYRKYGILQTFGQ